MKKAIFFLIFIMIASTVFAQEYLPMIKKGNQWNVVTKHERMDVTDPATSWFTTKYTVGDEIVRGDTIYHEIINEKGVRIYLVREDVDARKVYFNDTLFYDFSLEVNDTIRFYDNFNQIYTLRLDSIRPYQFENESWSRIFHLSYKIFDDEFRDYGHKWVEGMGSVIHGFNPVRPILIDNPSYDNLLCFKNGNIILFSNSNYETCDENFNANSDIRIKEVSIYPNPVTSSINIDLPSENKQVVIRISDVLGKIYDERQVQTTNGRMNLDITGMNKGLYLISIFNEATTIKKYFVGRFIVE